MTRMTWKKLAVLIPICQVHMSTKSLKFLFEKPGFGRNGHLIWKGAHWAL